MAASVIVGFGDWFVIMVVVLAMMSMSGVAMGNALIVPHVQGAVNHTGTHPCENAEKKK